MSIQNAAVAAIVQAHPMRSYFPSDCAMFCKVKEEFGELSNMAGGFGMRINGHLVLSSEALYQACRFPQLPQVQREILAQASPMAAKMKSKPWRQAHTRADWDEIRVDVMRWCLRVKLAQNWGEFRRVLLASRYRPIVERSRKDDFWGAKLQPDGSVRGANVLGQLLMELREALRQEDADHLRKVTPLVARDFLLLGEPIREMDFRPRERHEVACGVRMEQRPLHCDQFGAVKVAEGSAF